MTGEGGELAGVVVPAAGLGTRLMPLTESVPKEMLPLGQTPVSLGVLLEAAEAGVRDVVFVLAEGKAPLRQWLESQEGRWPFRLHTAVQPSPRGVRDAVERGRALLPPGPYAVLFPDYVHLPDQSGLRQLIRAWRARGERSMAIGVYQVLAHHVGIMGRTSRVRFTAADVPGEALQRGAGEASAASVPGPAPGCSARVGLLESGSASVGAWHTTFAEVRGAAYEDALGWVLAQQGEATQGRDASDVAHLAALRRLVSLGEFWGVRLSGDVLDMGIPSGYAHLRTLFEQGDARWRMGA